MRPSANTVEPVTLDTLYIGHLSTLDTFSWNGWCPMYTGSTVLRAANFDDLFYFILFIFGLTTLKIY